MNIILLLAPFSVLLGLMAVGAFVWSLRSGQYDDIQGAAARILIDDVDADSPGSGTPLADDASETDDQRVEARRQAAP
ncbi:MAG: cbb3-type cytochrome oxidase assembly protein CcoS [Alphaproteobacteria bacterium]|jgi:cbb3-type cytochrome oxidase maturation protein|nr:cbb3-type cytochrome oxidase assembly protein CcoS [Alphaproteobacteria bacterium]MBU2040575.1 cbb3-type cytochrome oxidase assembly protein CcoS [Alphaproteobacteria bacterium]MBU2125236.1 cbb3-type cytochrome oxidase assembly protein CcoS [Alphaproteobacteria bacterium]MBU2209972.1 cbb3-type cytochrome oxidase assembly protein CcoS [Alphaproteobacteria bacterium]MBU2290674.1 cbb3-type cytochrome oxidase assembly protein CcoS [Alphaproteobacteria bacterium]